MSAFVLSGTSEELKSFTALKVLAVAAKTNLSVTTKTVTEAELASLSTLATHGLALTASSNTFGGTSSTIMKVLASFSPMSNLCGQTEYEIAQVESWLTYGVTNIEVPMSALIVNNKLGGTSEIIDAIKKDMEFSLSVINCHVMPKSYMVGEDVTSADISLVAALKAAAEAKLWDPTSQDEKLTFITKWYNAILNMGFFQQAIAATSADSPVSATPAPATEEGNVVAFNGSAPPVVNKLYKRNRIRIKEILGQPKSYFGKTVTIAGWTKTVRKAGGKLLFIEMNDGSTGTHLQCILNEGETAEGFEESKKSGGTGSSFQLTGVVNESPAAGQLVELKVTKAVLLGAVYGGDPEGKTIGGFNYPMSKSGHSLEHMRTNAHLRARSGVHAAAMRIRHAMAFATHNFFHDNGFLYIHTPIITCADCEGAGEQFGITTLLGADHHKPDVKLPVLEELEEKKLSKKEKKRLAKLEAQGKSIVKEEETRVVGAVDYTQDFFGKRANLTVSGQLNVETHACALSDVYTFGPTFRAENSHTTRHLSEFWMIEPEISFATLEDDINLAEDYLKYCVHYALEMCKEDLEFFENSPHGEKGLIARLKNVLDNPFKRLTYTEAIVILEKAYADGIEFEVKPEWGIDLPSEHERYLCEKVFQKPVVLTNYPKEIKAFYMKLDDDGKTVSAADILVPKIGEIIGGSQREHRTDVLQQRCVEMGLDPKQVWWYLDLRKYGTVPHAGFGLGFERLILFITGLDNIRDVIPFPRWAGNAEF